MRSPEELTQRFREQGMRVTPQRQAVFSALREHGCHPTAEAVHAVVRAEMPSVSLRTVYQTLNELSALGELTPLHLGGGASRFDTDPDAHHHLVCDSCGTVTDVDADAATVALSGEGLEDFAVTTTDVVFHGTCGTCLDTAGAG